MRHGAGCEFALILAPSIEHSSTRSRFRLRGRARRRYPVHMLKFTKAFFGLLGVVALGGGIYFMVKLFWRWNQVVSIASANRSAPVSDPKIFIWLTIAAALVTGLMFGIAIAMPRRSARSIRNEARVALEHP